MAEFRENNHYVPCAYLKRWADGEGKVWTYRTLVSHPQVPLWKRSSIRGVAFHRHLYTRTATTGLTDAFERWLDRDFESPAEEAIDKAVNGARMSSGDWTRLIRFLAAQDVRTPARLMQMLTDWQKTLPSLIETTLQESVAALERANREGRKLELPKVSAYAETFPGQVRVEPVPNANHGFVRFETVVGRQLWLWALEHLLTRTIAALLEQRWTILLSPPGVEWITSDNPVVRLNYYGQGNYDFLGGWGSKGTEIFLPLSPRHLLYAKLKHRPPQRGTVASTEFAALVQRFNAEHAHRLIFSKYMDGQVAQLQPRNVDLQGYVEEQKQWRKWHEEQSAAEFEITAKKPRSDLHKY